MAVPPNILMVCLQSQSSPIPQQTSNLSNVHPQQFIYVQDAMNVQPPVQLQQPMFYPSEPYTQGPMTLERDPTLGGFAPYFLVPSQSAMPPQQGALPIWTEPVMRVDAPWVPSTPLPVPQRQGSMMLNNVQPSNRRGNVQASESNASGQMFESVRNFSAPVGLVKNMPSYNRPLKTTSLPPFAATLPPPCRRPPHIPSEDSLE